ncbi:hypothetical protein F5X96DRAFT_623834 [Biscogniauxia mediterranea]|nr:hypothetical protein F5X96DRAFT_623834 [Biscogniauxia mediterranea]
MAKTQGHNVLCGRMFRSAETARTRSSSWASLPTEIRLMILEEISRQKHRGWASCASVCKEWQVFIEQKNFYRLNLRASCLQGLRDMVVRQRHLVQYICLNIELLRYPCRSCQRTESSSQTSQHNSIVRETMHQLFSVLSTWQPTCRLILELNAYSPSDSEHWFKNYYFNLEHGHDGDLVQGATTQWHDPAHGWVDGQQVEAPGAPAILRLFSLLCISLPKSLPEVHAVTGLVIRRQLRRQICPAALRLLWERLPRLESIVYEPWRILERSWKIMAHGELASVIQDALPSHIRTVSIFEDFNDQLALALDSDAPYLGFTDTDPIVNPMLVGTLVSKSRDFERLSISYMIDARQFFKSCQLSYIWHRLQSLTLTSSILTQTAPQDGISALLNNASLIALNMPQLERMILWNGKRGEACAVIYHKKRGSGQATLTWRGTWDLELTHDVVESWKKVASDSYRLWIKNERVQGVINSHGDAIYHLRLPVGVIDPVSLWQIRQEGMMQRMA